MLLELTVYFCPDDFDPESADNLGTPMERTKGQLVINTDHLVAFNINDDSGFTMIRMSNGEVYEALIKYESFKNIMEGEAIAKDMMVSGEN